MKKPIFSVRTIVAIGIGAAIFVLLGRFTSLPFGFVPNTQLEFTYSFLSLMAAVFGPVAGFFIGIIGHALKDAIMWGSPWWSWVISSGVVGAIMGLAFFKIRVSEGVFGVKEAITFNLFQIVGNVIAWIGVAPTLDILIYAEPANKVYAQGALACVSNSVTVLVVGTILLAAYAKTRTKTGSLSKDE